MDAVFKALADESRRVLLDRLRERGGQTLGALCHDLAMTRQAVTKHLVVLEAAGLINVLWQGREKRHFLNPVPIHEVADRWIRAFERPHLAALRTLQSALENPMENDTFVYSLHIAATREQVWAALTRNEFWQQYWGGEWRVESEWEAGSPLQFFTGDGALFSCGEVLVSQPPATLTYTWPNPDQGAVPPEKLTWHITESGPGTVKLQLIHERVTPGYLDRVSEGWVSILSGLKTLLETGRPLAFTPKS